MYLTRLSFERYKAFAGRESVEIRPLTLLIGRNSSGKSAIARLPILLRHSLSGRSTAPVDLMVEGIDFGASFVDVIRGRSVHGAIGLGFEVRNQHETIDWWMKIQHDDNSKLQVVEHLDVGSSLGQQVSLRWPIQDPKPRVQRYQQQDGTDIALAFEGFHASAPSNGAVPELLRRAPQEAYRAFEPIRY